MSKSTSQVSESDIQRMRTYRRLNELRMQPLKSLPMTAFMMWMVGNEVSIFSIMFVGMAVVNPLQSIMGCAGVFAEFADDVQQDAGIRSAVAHSKLIYIGCCLIAFTVALVKLSWMGLMPVNAMDWLDTTPPVYKEHTLGVFTA
ncbi:TMEM85/ER membrane protein complex subunit 4 [Trypanosoma melophagium]|uniref:TMEM85/ER membrane protein complex subunit 4 n=1 Tax=Trypanosoma melophagium TaxID=715481 RepID=UPI00351A07EB|nr:TMEM85/ER membrane protein complex subunit 4 [Trypanosoma melophagium]